MRHKRIAAVAIMAVVLTACSSKPAESSETECHDVAKGRNCLTVAHTKGSDRYRVTETWVYKPDAPVVDGLPPVHRSEWVAVIDCETRASQLEAARFWDAQDREVSLGAAGDADVRRTLTASSLPPILTALCDSTN
ncbi:MAG: hypothetical protein ABIQ73_13745 [Acidimicrobiales bacterium]